MGQVEWVNYSVGSYESLDDREITKIDSRIAAEISTMAGTKNVIARLPHAIDKPRMVCQSNSVVDAARINGDGGRLQVRIVDDGFERGAAR